MPVSLTVSVCPAAPPGAVCAAPADVVLSVDAIFAADRLRKAG